MRHCSGPLAHLSTSVYIVCRSLLVQVGMTFAPLTARRERRSLSLSAATHPWRSMAANLVLRGVDHGTVGHFKTW